MGLEPRDQALLADHERHPVRRAAFERLAVAAADEADHRVVAGDGGPILDRPRVAFWSRSSDDDLLDLGVIDGLDLGREVEVLVVAEHDLGRDLDGRLEDDRLALDGLDHLDLGLGQGHDALLDQRLAVGALDQQLDRLIEDRRWSEDPLEHEPGGLALPEARDLGPPRQAAGRLVHRAIEAL